MTEFTKSTILASNNSTTGARTNLASDVLLRQFIGYNMKRVYMLIQDDLAEHLEPLGLRTATLSALAVIAGSHGISQTQLSEVLNIKRSGVVVLIDELESAGVVERAPVEGDRRAYSLRLTSVGRSLWEKAQDTVLRHEQALFERLGPDDLTALRDILERAATCAASFREMKSG